MGVVYVTSQNRKAGKTMVAMALASIASGQQSLVTFLRIGATEHSSDDLETMLGQGNSRLSKVDTAEVSCVVNAVKEESSHSSLVVVDSSSDMSTSDHAEIVEETKAKVLLVSDFRDKDSSLPYAQKFEGNTIGILINCLTAYGRTEAVDKIIPSFQNCDVNVLGLIPEDRTLLSLTVGQISELLGGTFFTGSEYSDRLVENFMVGSFGMDPGEYTFSTKNKKAVIVRGDRPDVQMSALQTDMQCFILTRGMEPIEYVKYECEEEEVAAVIVDTDTIETMKAIGSLQRHARFDHPDKLDRAKKLLADATDVKIITG
jgi:hypothetical protein